MNLHEHYMQRCLELARLGAGKVAPNPMVGAVVVYQDKIIGEGYHREYGKAHAEVNAIEAVKDKSLLAQSTIYVSLEPCSHQGKTPPCADLIIHHKIPRVVIACADPNPLVAGKGMARLEEAGIEVIKGVLEKEAQFLNRRFICGITQHRPWVILKWAQTQNGYLSPDASKMSAAQFEKERHITGLWVQKLVHKWRTTEDAIMVGTNTALTDNPALNTRAFAGRPPARVVLNRTLRLPSTLKVFDGSQKTFIINEQVEKADGNNYYIKVNFDGNWWEETLTRLYTEGIQSLVVEGGAQLLNHILNLNLWDETLVFYSPHSFSDGVPAPAAKGNKIFQDIVDDVILVQYLKT